MKEMPTAEVASHFMGVQLWTSGVSSTGEVEQGKRRKVNMKYIVTWNNDIEKKEDETKKKMESD